MAVKKTAPKKTVKPAAKPEPKPEFVTGDLGPVKPKPAKVEPPPPPVHVPTERAASDPATVAQEAEPANVPGGPVHRAPCDPPSRT